MDKKELNDLIDRVVLTGPGGVDRIKKILKELVSTNGEDSGDSDGSSNLLERFKVIEDYFNIDLSPNLDEKYYQYFTIEAIQNGTKVYFRQSSYAANSGLNPLKVEVSTDSGETWEEITAAQAENSVPGALLAELDEGNKVLIRGRNEAYGFYHDEEEASIENCNFLADKPCYIYGNIMSLVGGDNFARLRKVEKNAFAFLFSDYDSDLDWSWVFSKEGEELTLPATTLSDSCYCAMFERCNNLVSAPALPAMVLTENCYGNMFYECTNLASAPELPATTLASTCYCYMFYSCNGLTSAPELPATILAERCYEGMFLGCSNLSYIKAMFTTTPTASYTGDWIMYVKPTGTFVKNSLATWDVTGNNGIPSGWAVETADA